MSVNNNEIYNSIRPNSGYGVNVASGTAFVNIDHNHIENCRHDWLLNNVPIKKSILSQFLKAGYFENGRLFTTDKGTPICKAGDS